RDGLVDRVTRVAGDLAGGADQRADQLGPLGRELPQLRTRQVLLRPAQLLAQRDELLADLRLAAYQQVEDVGADGGPPQPADRRGQRAVAGGPRGLHLLVPGGGELLRREAVELLGRPVDEFVQLPGLGQRDPPPAAEAPSGGSAGSSGDPEESSGDPEGSSTHSPVPRSTCASPTARPVDLSTTQASSARPSGSAAPVS